MHLFSAALNVNYTQTILVDTICKAKYKLQLTDFFDNAMFLSLDFKMNMKSYGIYPKMLECLQF